MRFVLAFVLLAACELQPAPKKQPAPPAEVTPTAPVPAPPPSAPADAGVAVADAAGVTIEASEACVTVGAHVADVFVQSATDPAQRAVYEQERTKMVKATAEACTKQRWSDAAQKCYVAATTPALIKACENKFPPAPPAGAGSAAGSGANEVRAAPGRRTGAGSGR